VTRPELFVFIALAIGWAVIAAWTIRLASKLNRLSRSDRQD
jgi:hypothetical protein